MIQFMRGTKSQLNNNSSIIAAGQPVFESDTGQLKIGNGSSRYSALEYVGSIFENTSSGGGEVTFGGSGPLNTYVDFPGGLRLSYGVDSCPTSSFSDNYGSIYFVGTTFAVGGIYLNSVKSRVLCYSLNLGKQSSSTIYDLNAFITSSQITSSGGIQYRIAWPGTSSQPSGLYVYFMIWSRD